ncbi:MAG TPA: membrane-spanning protein [Pseudobacillus sp.]
MKKKAILILSIAFVILIASASFVKHLNGESVEWIDVLSRIFVGMVPMLLLFSKRIPFSLPLIISYYILLFCSFFLGALVGLYDRFSWWDTALHFFGSAFAAFVAVDLYKLFTRKSAEQNISSWLIFLFALSFSVTASVVWESVEFIGSVIGVMESDTNKDTMIDLLSGTAGGLIIALYAAFRKNK